MRITGVDAIPYALPRRRPARFASGAISRAEGVVVRVRTDEGLVGHAEAQPRPYTYGETQPSIVAAVRGHLGPALEGLDPLATERAHERFAGLAANHTARGAVDLALWDLAGQALGRPCRELLGAYADEVAVAHLVGLDTPEAMAEEALAVHARHGVRAFKVKVGRDPALDVRAVEAIRAALPDATLTADANRGWTLAQALRAGDALVALGVGGIEEPLEVDDRRGRRRLAERWPVPLVGDESCVSLAHVARELHDGAVGTVSVKAARTGFTESRRVLALCLAHRVPAVAGSQYEGGLGALATAHLACASAQLAGGPAELMNVADLADDLLAEPVEVRDGRFAPPPLPGLGAVVDEDKLAHFALEPLAVR